MVINGYTSWPIGVNKIILDSSAIEIGEDEKGKSQSEGGGTRIFTKGFFVPDRYTVTMEFSWLDDDRTPIDGENEYTRFIKWYKYIHRYGRVPFEFPQILYSPEAGETYYDEKNNTNYKTEYYKIISKLPGKKVGDKVSVQMTWETVFFGVVDLDENNLREIYSSGEAHNGYLDIAFSQLGMTEPVSSDFNLFITVTGQPETQLDKIGYNFDNYIARIYFPKQEKGGSITFSYNSRTLDIPKGQYIFEYKV